MAATTVVVWFMQRKALNVRVQCFFCLVCLWMTCWQRAAGAFYAICASVLRLIRIFAASSQSPETSNVADRFNLTAPMRPAAIAASLADPHALPIFRPHMILGHLLRL